MAWVTISSRAASAMPVSRSLRTASTAGCAPPSIDHRVATGRAATAAALPARWKSSPTFTLTVASANSGTLCPTPNT